MVSKPRYGSLAGTHPWLMTVWLLAGPLPLLMVLSLGAHKKVPADLRGVPELSTAGLSTSALVQSLSPGKAKQPRITAASVSQPSPVAAKPDSRKTPVVSR